MIDSANTTELLQRGKAATRAGRLDEARAYLDRAVQLEPDNVEAWLALTAVVPDPAQKIACFETILRLQPDNVEARLGLEMLQQDMQPGESAAQVTQEDLEAVIAEASRRLEEAVGPPVPGEVPPDDGVLYCANHPDVQTMLRCNRCGKPICTRCAVLTPVGYRCKQCVGRQQAVFFTGGVLDYVIGGAIALVLGGVVNYLMVLLGAWFFALILGPTVGIGMAEIVRFAVRRRRSRYQWLVVAASFLVSSLPALLLVPASPFRWLALGLFLALAVGATTARLR